MTPTIKPKMRKFFLAACLALLITTSASADGGEFIQERGVVSQGYNFWVYEPAEYKTDKHPLPVIVFLHGASLCGNNLQKVRRYGVLDAIDKGLPMPMFVVAPQNSGGAWNPEKICRILDWMERNYAIDTTRVYVLGMSLGGYGTLDFTGAHPERVAAAMALCGGTTLKDMSHLGDVPLWIVHGTADKAVNIKESKKVVEYLQASGRDSLLRYDWLKGAGHGTPARYFYMQKTYDWLLSHSTADSPRELDSQIEITKEDIDNTYQDLREALKYYDEE